MNKKLETFEDILAITKGMGHALVKYGCWEYIYTEEHKTLVALDNDLPDITNLTGPLKEEVSYVYALTPVWESNGFDFKEYIEHRLF